MISYIRNLGIQQIIDVSLPIIQRNGYFLHSENVLVSMISDEDIDIRKLAIEIILKSREQHRGDRIREFKIPKINFNATEYYSLIEYNEDWLEPRLTEDYLFNTNCSLNLLFPLFPCHTQSVERAVRIVSETSKMFSNPNDRNSRIYSTILLRRVLPKFDTKRQFTF